MTSGIIVPFDQSAWNLHALPAELKKSDRFVIWRVGAKKPNGKFEKIPFDPKTCRGTDANDPANWLTFAGAMGLFGDGRCDGIGIALDGQPDKHGRYLTCIDLDGVPSAHAEAIQKRLGMPWGECSPSGNGYHFWMWSREPLKGGNAHGGRELYQRGRFVTVTGWGSEAVEEMVDATEELQALHVEWFGDQTRADRLRGQLQAISGAARGVDDTTRILLPQTLPLPAETPEKVDEVRAMLAVLDPDCEYTDWRDTVWAVLGTGWGCAEELAREWSKKGQKYADEGFDVLVRGYRSGGIGFGTLIRKARAAGYGAGTGSDVVQLTAGAAASYGDVANGRQFAEHWRGKLVYLTNSGAWLRWNDQRWQLCQKGEDMAAAKATAGRMVDKAKAALALDPSVGGQLMKHAVTSHNLGRLEAMLRLARCEGGMAVVGSELDADHYLLGTANGTVDLRTRNVSMTLRHQ